MSRGSSSSRIYVGGLPPDVRSGDIEDIFYKYGRIVDVDLKNRRPGPPFAFVEFEDPRDAEDAVRGRDGYDFDGYRLRVEAPHGRGGSRGGRPQRFGYMGRGGRGPPPRRGDYRVHVSSLPSTGSWQDLKDHMREAGDVTFADVYRDGTGVVEFSRRSDMEFALRNLDDTKFRSHEGDVSYIRVREDTRGGGRSRSRSRSRSPRGRSSPSRSRSRSPRRDSRSRSPSPRRSYSRSPYRSP